MDIKMKHRISVWGFFMTLVIAVYHCGGGLASPMNAIDAKLNEMCNNFFNNLAVLAMCHFFVISGFLFYYKFKLDDYIAKIKRRVFTLLIPYLIWQVIYTPIILQGNGDIKFIFRTTFLLECWPPNGPLWYLYVIFILSIFAPVLFKLFQDEKKGVIVCFLVCVVAYYLGNTMNPAVQSVIQYGYVGSIVGYFPAYVLGIYYGIHENRRTHENSLKYCVIMLCCAMGIECILEGFLYYFVYRLLPIFVLYLWPVKRKDSELKLINLSFLIYALHHLVDGYLTPMVREGILIINPSAFFGNLMGRGISLVLIIIFVNIVWRFLSFVSAELLNYLTGGRVKPYLHQSNKINKKTF